MIRTPIPYSHTAAYLLLINRPSAHPLIRFYIAIAIRSSFFTTFF